ncbi:unnamed protein product [Brassica napus]|uniref:(rape) hypothetical protein n=1 Tax=Brassica napus TaxID=3708 RepID=A0A816Y8T8_BRANA|nr:unnamed protein product [Brassica napus]
MTDIDPLHQKPDSMDGFEDFMDEDCISFESCSTIHNPDNDHHDQEDEQPLRRRRRSDHLHQGGGDDIAESSAARQSRILSGWAARQAGEMITTIERRNRESELIAIAGLHAVSTLDSFLSLGRRRRGLRRLLPLLPGGRLRGRGRGLRRLGFCRCGELEDEHVLNRARERMRLRVRSADVAQAESQVSESENGYGSSSREQSPDLGDSLLRGRFLRSETPSEEVRAPSVAASEIRQLRERQTVSGLREGARDRPESNTNADNINTTRSNQITANTSEDSQLLNESLNSSRQGNGTPLLPNDLGNSGSNQPNPDRNWDGDTSQERAWSEVFTTDERRDLLQATLSQFSERDNGPENSVGDLHQDGTGNNSNETVIVEGQSVWPADNSRQSDGNQPETRV